MSAGSDLPVPTTRRRRTVHVAAGWAIWILVVLLASGGAASRPGGWLLGFPTATQAACVLGLAGVVAAAAGLKAGRLALGLAPVPLLLLLGAPLGAPLPGLMALSGPPLFALGLASAAAMIASRPPRWAGVVFLPVVAAVYACGAARTQAQVGPQGDEPHYLMVAESLLRDGDLSLEEDYAAGRYRAFHPEPLAPHYRVRGRGGAIYSLHAVGLSLLILPAYWAGGYPAVSFFMAFLAVLLAREIRELVGAWLGNEGPGQGVAWVIALSPPLIHYAGLIFTEVPAALVMAVALRFGGSARGLGAAGACGLALAFLPWLHVRYAILTVLALLYVLSHRPRRSLAAAWCLPSVLSAAASALYHFLLYGFFDPRRVWGRRPEFSPGVLPEGLPGLFLDQEFGLLIYAPIFALAVPGFVYLFRRDRRCAVVALAVVAAIVMTAASWPMWRGGFNPPARFLVPALSVLAVAVAACLRTRLTAGALLLAGWSLWTGLTGAWEPRLVHRDRDGTAPLFRVHSGAREWTGLLPGYVLEESRSDRLSLSLIWSVALGLAVTLGRGTPRAGGVACACGGLLLAAGLASSASNRPTGGRDAVRVVGRPAIQVPGWNGHRSAPAEWGPSDLDWGPTYEPHRHPAGAEIGSRLTLPPGRYDLRLEGEVLGPPPQLVVRSGPTRELALQSQEGALLASFDVSGGEVTLALKGGGPFILKGIHLAHSTFSAPNGLTR